MTLRALALKNARDTFREVYRKFCIRRDELFALQERSLKGNAINAAFAQLIRTLNRYRVDVERRERVSFSNGCKQSTMHPTPSLRGLMDLTKETCVVLASVWIALIECELIETRSTSSVANPLDIRPQISPNAPAL